MPKTVFRAWGQDPMRPGRTFADEAEARAWAEREAPKSCGWAFVENTKTKAVALYRAETGKWS